MTEEGENHLSILQLNKSTPPRLRKQRGCLD